jgi:hypothetical protein
MVPCLMGKIQVTHAASKPIGCISKLLKSPTKSSATKLAIPCLRQLDLHGNLEGNAQPQAGQPYFKSTPLQTPCRLWLYPNQMHPCSWTHDTWLITFTLVTDDFGIKYVRQQHANHLINSVKAMYNLSLDWTSLLYCGLRLAWGYHKRTAGAGYIEAALHKFQHPPPDKIQDAPHDWNKPVYGSKIQYATHNGTADNWTQMPSI